MVINKHQVGQTALESAFILIVLVVVVSVFAFTIMSARSSSPEKNKQTLQTSFENVQSHHEN